MAASSLLAFSIFCPKDAFQLSIFCAIASLPSAIIYAASIAAFCAPLTPTVATGIPGGI